MSTVYCNPSDILTDAATVTVTTSATAAGYPVANISDRLAHTVAKSVGTTITYQAVFSGAKTLQAVALVNTNATAVTLTNGAGLSQALTIPTTPEDGLPLDPWIDLRGLGSTSSTTWTIALTGPTGVALGDWLLIQTLHTMPIRWIGLEETEAHRAIVHETDYGVRLKLGLGVRQRAVQGNVVLESFRASLLALQRDAEGPRRSFLLVMNDADHEGLYVDLTTDARVVMRRHPRISEIELVFTQQQNGWL